MDKLISSCQSAIQAAESVPHLDYSCYSSDMIEIPDAEQLLREIEIFGPELLNYITGRIPPRHRSYISPEDILQEVWTAAIHSRKEVPTSVIPLTRSWLYTTAKNKLYDAIRSANSLKRGGHHVMQPMYQRNSRDSFVELFSFVSSQYSTPSRITAAQEIVAAVNHALSKLPDNRQEAIRLFHIEGKSREEIARVMGKSIWAIMSLLATGRQQLRNYLGSPEKFFSDAFMLDPVTSQVNQE
ncbi:MAG: hypothetical protein HJJLKODD_00052 [Phycisphaerae bacterium]|nr:hypothetical protein [Phycisphaerae bacterium]